MARTTLVPQRTFPLEDPSGTLAGMRFTAKLQLAGKTATGFHVPAEVVNGLGGGRRPAVRVTIGDYSYRSTIAARSGTYKLPVSADNREGAGISAGDTVDIQLELDTEPREVAIPGDLAEALAEHPEARAFLDGLSFSRQQWYVMPIEQAKKPETRERRIAKAVAMLRERRLP
jgi:Bacteriocin-protection, YdeI or OmpD-Associated/Domain of unknown function (DUF1905)